MLSSTTPAALVVRLAPLLLLAQVHGLRGRRDPRRAPGTRRRRRARRVGPRPRRDERTSDRGRRRRVLDGGPPRAPAAHAPGGDGHRRLLPGRARERGRGRRQVGRARGRLHECRRRGRRLRRGLPPAPRRAAHAALPRRGGAAGRRRRGPLAPQLRARRAGGARRVGCKRVGAARRRRASARWASSSPRRLGMGLGTSRPSTGWRRRRCDPTARTCTSCACPLWSSCSSRRTAGPRATRACSSAASPSSCADRSDAVGALALPVRYASEDELMVHVARAGERRWWGWRAAAVRGTVAPARGVRARAP